MRLSRLIFAACFGLSLASAFAQNAVKSTPVSTPTVDSVKKVPAAGQSWDEETRLVLKALSQRYQALGDWRANFTQDVLSVALGSSGEMQQGKFLFQRPNKFVFTIVSPEASDFVSDGKQLWYVQYRQGRAKEASVKHWKNLSYNELDRYLLLLRGIQALTPAKEKDLKKNFRVKGESKNGAIKLTLEPRDPKELVRVSIEFDRESQAPSRATLEDTLGNKNVIKIFSWEKVDVRKLPKNSFEPAYVKGSKVEEL